LTHFRIILIISINLLFQSNLTGVGLESAASNALKKKPSWVLNRPNPRDYYIGIGIATHTGNLEEDMRRATSNAYSDLAAALKVHVESRTEDIVREENGITTEIMDYKVETTVSSLLEGIEVVDTWSEKAKKEGYWVYVRLSKVMLAEKEKIKRDNLTTIAHDNYNSALKSISAGSITSALRLFIDGYVKILEYENDPIEVQDRGRKIILNTALLQGAERLLLSLQLNAANASNLAGIFQQPLDEQLEVKAEFVANGNAIPVSGLPIKFQPVASKMHIDTVGRTDKDGISKSTVYRLLDSKRIQHVSASLDLEKIIKSVSTDSTLTMLASHSMSSLNLPTVVLEIKVSNLIFRDIFEFENIERRATRNLIKEGVRGAMTQQLGVVFTDKSEKSNYIIRIHGFTESASPNDFGFFFSFANFTFTIEDHKTGEVIYSKVLQRIKGAGMDENSANKKAILNGINKFKTEVIDEISVLLGSI